MAPAQLWKALFGNRQRRLRDRPRYFLDVARLQVTEPRIAAPPLDVRKPAAGRIKRDHHEHPDQINHGQRKPPAGWLSEGKVCNVWGFKHPVSLPVTRVTHDDCQQMNEWDVQQKIKHRYFAEDQRWPQETR